ncbi:hypothetical protein UFOVP49_33 [uncultured Caudovirales phage]|uniref:Uncharacterized protein n=1 Tax=uncultured Caudovirales phage TaxID=2100421 RepID=A0A6J5KSB3_9CAUD|nr:hypothetical protein UFOVP49_33 [uncultured Caudovirales phage]
MEYTFKIIKSGKIVSYDMKVSEYDEFKINHPELERYIDSAPVFNYRGSSDFKTDNTWNEVLSKVAEKHPGSPLAEKHKKKTSKEIKTRDIFNKHVK